MPSRRRTPSAASACRRSRRYWCRARFQNSCRGQHGAIVFQPHPVALQRRRVDREERQIDRLEQGIGDHQARRSADVGAISSTPIKAYWLGGTVPVALSGLRSKPRSWPVSRRPATEFRPPQDGRATPQRLHDRFELLGGIAHARLLLSSPLSTTRCTISDSTSAGDDVDRP